MTYELAKQLKNAGYKWNWCDDELEGCLEECFPPLSELIEACGKGFKSLLKRADNKKWVACKSIIEQDAFLELEGYSTPEEAVAKLWLELLK